MNRERLYEPIQCFEEFPDGKGHPIDIRLGRVEDGAVNLYGDEGVCWHLTPEAAKELLAQLKQALEPKCPVSPVSPVYVPYYGPGPTYALPLNITCDSNF